MFRLEMEKQEKRRHLLETLVYAVIGLLVLSTPVLKSKYDDESIIWCDVLRIWRIMLPFFSLFLINNYLLIPFFLLKKRKIVYCALLVCSIALLLCFTSVQRHREFLMGKGPAHEQRGKLCPPEQRNRVDFPPPKFQRKPDHRPFPFSHKPWMRSPLFDDLLLALLIAGLNIAIRLLFKSIQDDYQLKELEKQNLQTELENLKYQINPHFFMNTLNNIHALIDRDAEKAKETVIGLSKLMRYVLYDASQPLLPLQQEVNFISNYVELMRLRYTDCVDIKMTIPAQIPDVKLPPLLFISFVENAFKHGVSYRKSSFIHIAVDTDERQLHFRVTNSCFTGSAASERGIGQENARKRLALLYEDRYVLDISMKKGTYVVELTLPRIYDTLRSSR